VAGTSLEEREHLDLELRLVSLLFLGFLLLLSFLLFLDLDGFKELWVEGGKHAEYQVTDSFIWLNTSLENNSEDIGDSRDKYLKIVVLVGLSDKVYDLRRA
jgi:hypothetical protein